MTGLTVSPVSERKDAPMPLTLPFCPVAVIFDMDGLLVDSEPVWEVVEDALLTARGKVLSSDIRNPLIGLRMHDFWSQMRTSLALEEEVDVLIAEVVARFLDGLPDGALERLSASELIRFLADRRVPIAIASSSPRAIIDGVVEARGWDRFFPVRVSGDDVPHGKPAPDIYLETARRLGVKPEQCLALEDSRNGARAAVAAGMLTVAVPDLSHGTPEGLAAITPLVVESLGDVLRALEAQACY